MASQKSYSSASSSSQQSPSAWEPAQPYLQRFYEFAEKAAQQAPQYYQGSTLASQSPWTQEGISSLGQAGRMQDWLYGQSVPAYQAALNAADLNNNPYVSQYADALRGRLNADQSQATRRLTQNFQEELLPSVNAGAARAGGIGGSRQALAQAVAMSRTSRDMQDYMRGSSADVGAQMGNLYNEAYKTGVDSRTAALQMMPQYLEAGTLGSRSRLGAGSLQEARQQDEIDADRERFEYYRDYPAKMAQLYGSLFSSANVPFGTEGTSTSSEYSYSKQKSGSGFASALSGLGSLIGGFTAASDRRLKRNIRRIGTTGAGYPIYSFMYVWGEPSVGVMADEVPPEWTIKHPSGYLMVDYSKVC